MEIRPGNDFVFSVRSHTLVVRWHWNEDEGMDDEQFTLSVIENGMKYGAAREVVDFVEQLPLVGSYAETENLLTKAITALKGKGLSLHIRPFNTGFN